MAVRFITEKEIERHSGLTQAIVKWTHQQNAVFFLIILMMKTGAFWTQLIEKVTMPL